VSVCLAHFPVICIDCSILTHLTVLSLLGGWESCCLCLLRRIELKTLCHASRSCCAIAPGVVVPRRSLQAVVALRSHFCVLRGFLMSLLLIWLLDLLGIMKVRILIKFCLLKTVDAIMWGDALMLLILVQTSATIRLPREEILLLKVLRIVLIILQNILLAAVTLVAAFAVWSALIRGLTRCIGVHQISFIELVDGRTWWFCSTYTLGSLVAKDIARRERIGSRTHGAGTQRLLLLCSWYLWAAKSQRWSCGMLVWHHRILIYFAMIAKGWLFLVHFLIIF